MEKLTQTPLFDKKAAQYVLGVLMRTPELIYNEDRYILSIDDFDDKLYQMFFSAIYNLSNSGAKLITPPNIDMYLSQYPSQYELYKQNDGYTLIQLIYEQTEEFDIGQFDLYYNRIKKFSTLRELRAKGFNIDEFYRIDFLGQDEVERNFNKLSVSDILNKIRNKIQIVENHNVSRQDSTGQYACKGIRDLMQSLRQNPEVGIPMEGKYINYTTRGCRKGKMYLYSAPSGGGKALPNSTLVPMFNGGWKEVGQVQVGDLLIDRKGNPTKVLQIYPQGYKRVYEVRFKDGRSALCNDEHLWSYNTLTQRGNSLYTKTLREIINEGKNTQYKTTDGGFKYLVPMNSAVNYPKKDLQIDPYLLGLMLGDGSFRQHESNKALQFSTSDIELVNSIINITNWGFLKASDNNYTYYFYDKDTKKNIYVEDFLVNYKDLLNTYSYTKFIPDDYLYSSIEDRWALFQGLMDTDGSIDNKGRCCFSTTSDKLATQFRQLCLSLGLKPTVRRDERPEKYTTGYCYDITIASRPEDKANFFRLTRKMSIVQSYLNNGKRKESNTHNAIVAIEDLGYEEEMTCFYVDNAEHLFLTEDFIVTHNTRTMLGNACSIAYPRIENGKIVSRPVLEPVLFVATEMQPDEIQTLILSWISGVNEENILLNKLTEDEVYLLNIAANIMEKYEKNFIIESIPNPSIRSLKSMITNYILHDNVEYVFYDYIFTSVGLMDEFSSVNLREDVVLMMLSNTLKEIAADYNVFVMTGTQLNGTWEGKTVRNANMLRGSKAIADKIDVGMIGVRCTEDELEAINPYIQEMGYVQPNIVIDVYKNRRGKMCDVKIFRKFDYGTCRTFDVLVTTTGYKPVDNLPELVFATNVEELKNYE